MLKIQDLCLAKFHCTQSPLLQWKRQEQTDLLKIVKMSSIGHYYLNSMNLKLDGVLSLNCIEMEEKSTQIGEKFLLEKWKMWLKWNCSRRISSHLICTKLPKIIQCTVLQAHPRIIFLDSTSITKKFRYSLEKLPGSWNFCFFYFEHCVLAISKLHLPTCLTKIGEFHSIKCLFWTPIFFMITVFHTMAINIFFLEIYGIFWKSRSF